tara:strand:+ start:19893 stop:20654 length:762 start_codon:yes stop_codon:yes gene_type:complete
MVYDGMTVLQLKTLCKERGLRVSGNKSEVIIRLMENDEEHMAPAPAPAPALARARMPQQVYPQHIPGGYIPQNPIYVKKESELASGIGICIILYAIFRLFWAVIFSFGAGGEQAWLLSPVAFILGLGFLVGGAITYAGYKNGIFLTLGILGISGLFSIAFHGDEVNPVSIAFGDQMVMTSIMCSAICMITVALPLLITPLKEGWPEPIENLLGKSNAGGKKKVMCSSCQTELQIPNDYSGKIECPSCKAVMNV